MITTDSNLIFAAVSAGVIVGVLLTIYTKSLNANAQKAIVALGGILAVIAQLASSGVVAAPALFLAFDAGYVAGIAFETNQNMQAIRLRLMGE